MARVTADTMNELLENLREVGEKFGIDGAEYWSFERGPYGWRLVERHHDDGNWTTEATALGRIDGRIGVVYQRLADVYRGLSLAHKNLPPTALQVLGRGPEPRDNEESARNFFERQMEWLRKQDPNLQFPRF